MINLISSAITGLVIGILAQLLYPGDQPLGFWMTMLLGVAGSLLAGMITNRGKTGFNRAGFLASVLGAMVLIFAGNRLL